MTEPMTDSDALKLARIMARHCDERETKLRAIGVIAAQGTGDVSQEELLVLLERIRLVLNGKEV